MIRAADRRLCRRKLRPRIRPQNGMPFPDRPSGGNYDPEFGSKTGYAFPVASLAETASRNELSERGTLSHRGFKRKPCPGIEPQGGAHFPVEAWDGRRVPESGYADDAAPGKLVANMELFNSYVRGGIEEMYEQFIDGHGVTADEYLDRAMDVMETFKDELDDVDFSDKLESLMQG